MIKKVQFTEEQQFRQMWVWVIILIIVGVWFYGVIQQVLIGKSFGNNPTSDTVLILFGIIPLLLIYLIFKLKLITIIDKEGVHCRFSPLQRKAKTILPDDISEYYIRQYKPIAEYGGWGVRRGLRKYGNAYNVTGKTGMQFILKDGKKFLIGTQKADSLKRALDKLMDNKQLRENLSQ